MLHFLWRMALREFRRGRRKFIFFLLCIAIGVGALVAVKGFNANLQTALLREARTLIAADLKLTVRAPAREPQQEVLDRLHEQGIQTAYITETVSMAVAPSNGNSVLTEVKAVSPGYPYYGALVVDPAGVALLDTTTWVSPDLLEQFQLQVGDEIKVGSARFQISGVILQEPDRITAELGLAPRVMITQGGIERAELIQFGSLANHIYLVKLASDEQVEPVRAELRSAFAGMRPRLTDYREAHPQVRRILDRMTSFLSLLSMVALLVGGLGVANATRIFIHEKLDAIAIMKCLGGTNRRVTGVYLLQVLLLSLTGSLLGIGAGYGLQLALPGVVGSLLNLSLTMTLHPAVALQGLIVGLVTALLFALLPLTMIAGVKPALVFRREMAESQPPPSFGSRLVQWALVTAIGLILALLAAWVSGSLEWGFLFMAGLAGAVVLLGGASALAVRLVRYVKVPAAWLSARQGLKNLHRPGSQAGSVVLALGVGVAMVMAIILVQRSLLREIESVSPKGAPNMIFLNIQHGEVAAFHDLLREAPGVQEAPEPSASVRGRLVRIDGKGPSELPPEQAREMNRVSLTQGRLQPSGSELLAGRWWEEADYADGHLASVEQDDALELGLTVGSVVELELQGGIPVQATVFNIRTEVDVPGVGRGGDLLLTPGALDAAAPTYTGQARVAPEATGEVQRRIVAEFPGVTVVNLNQLLANIGPLLERISLVIRFVAGFSVAAGLIILASSIAATRFRRTREAVLYKTLGATRRRVWGIFAVEYASMGLVAAIIGGGLSVGATWVVVTQVLELDFRWDLPPLAYAVGAAVALTVLVGLLSTLGVMRAKPLRVLRDD